MSRETIGRRMEILLVEDSLTDAALTIGNLKQGEIPHRLTLVRDGAEAMEFLQREGRFARVPRPDLVLLDLQLPKKDGIEVLQDMKLDEKLQTIPVVILTGSQDERHLERCRELGADHYIVKPVDLEKFIGVIREMRSHLHADVILPSLG